jgi:ATP synthase subunit 6
VVEVAIKTRVSLLDPLEQFEVLSYKCAFFTNLYCYVLVIYFVIFFFLFFNLGEYRKIRPNLILFRGRTFRFLARQIKENLNAKIVLFFPVIYLTFLFILIGNLVGMLPYSFTVMSSAVVAFFFSLTFFIGITGVGYGLHKDALFRILLPAGVPLYLAPFLVLVEAVSYFARVCSLAVRLFANVVSGHSLLKILVPFV